MVRPRVFIDFSIDHAPAGRINLELFNDLVPEACDKFCAIASSIKDRGTATLPIGNVDVLSETGAVISAECFQGLAALDPQAFFQTNYECGRPMGVLAILKEGCSNTIRLFLCTGSGFRSTENTLAVGRMSSGIATVVNMDDVPTGKSGVPLKPIQITGLGELSLRHVPSKPSNFPVPAHIYDLSWPALSEFLRSITGPDLLYAPDTAGRVVRIAPGLVVKHSGSNKEEELIVMSYIRQQTNIPVPKYFPLHSSNPPPYYICMEEVQGVTLESCLEDMSGEDLESIATQLRNIVQQLRSLPNVAGELGSITGGQYRNDAVPKAVATKGCFRDVVEFNQFWRDSLMHVWIKEPVDELIGKLPTDCPVAFCHGDLAPRNIFVEGSTITGIIDWEFAGWYPDYWEYCRMRFAGSMLSPSARWSNNWDDVMHAVFPRDDNILDTFSRVQAAVRDLL